MNFLNPYNIIMTHHKEYVTKLNLYGLKWKKPDPFSVYNMKNNYSSPYSESIHLPDINDISGIGVIGEEGAIVSSTRKFVFLSNHDDYVRSICL